jgi:hypothetical protein
MLLLALPIAWIAVMTLVAAICAMAARGDATQLILPEAGQAAPPARRTPSAPAAEPGRGIVAA